MNPEHAQPFIEGVECLFSTMLNCSVDRGEIRETERCAEGGDVTALIGVSGPGRGTVALSFPNATAEKMVARLMDIPETELEDSVIDGVAELVNIVAGQAKAKFSPVDGVPLNLSLPTVVRGRDYHLATPTRSFWLDIPFLSELGPFHLRLTFVFNP